MDIPNERSHVPPARVLRMLAEAQGIHPEDADLEVVARLLGDLLPALEQLEQMIPRGTVPAGLFLPIE